MYLSCILGILQLAAGVIAGGLTGDYAASAALIAAGLICVSLGEIAAEIRNAASGTDVAIAELGEAVHECALRAKDAVRNGLTDSRAAAITDGGTEGRPL